MSSNRKNTQLLVTGLVAAVALGVVVYFATRPAAATTRKKKLDDDDKSTGRSVDFAETSSDATPRKSNESSSKKGASGGGSTSGSSTIGISVSEERELHSKIEELDKKGKGFFKNKQYLEAAAAFTEALDYINQHTDPSNPMETSSSLNKQIVTLINNRSAMYEKGNFPELAIEDCNKILEVYDISHSKARQRKLRILESKFKDYYQALVECCALQLLFMHQHRDQLRMGLPASSPPPVPQAKLEELVQRIIPPMVEEYGNEALAKQMANPQLPSSYTLGQLLKSYTGYNAWMAKAARDGSVTTLKKQLAELPTESTGADPTVTADLASAWMKIGRRHVYDADYSFAREAIIKAYTMVENKPDVQAVMKDDDYPRLLEWTGMVKHWAYELDEAEACYRKCAELEPLNPLAHQLCCAQAEVMVKQAGVAMDANKHKEALELFDRALTVDPTAIDALLHRANLRMLQADLISAKADLERCVKLRPDYVLAHLRLAAVLTSMNDPLGAKRHLETAERVDPGSSDVQSYRGELLFTQNEFVKAKEQFDKAIKLEPNNPTPYVNSALAILNTPPAPGMQMEMARDAIELFEKAIEVDPQFQAAYVQMGQLKLGMATDIGMAREVIVLYEKALSHCRTKEEMRELMGMKVLTQAQVDAATNLKMETFNMQ